MDRRSFLTTLGVAAAVATISPAAVASISPAAITPSSVAIAPSPAPGQDLEYERALDRAQRLRPRIIGPSARIAPIGEPGTPLVIHGRVLQRDGRTPARDVVVFAYHTDATGIYDAPAAGPHSWRLKGWAKTGADGRFEFTTIRPAPYPSRHAAAHVHFSIDAPGAPRQSAGLLLAGDPLLTPAELNASAAAGEFGEVRAIDTRDGVAHVTILLKLNRSQRHD